MFAVSSQSLVWMALDRCVAFFWSMKVHIISSKFSQIAIPSNQIKHRAIKLAFFTMVAFYASKFPFLVAVVTWEFSVDMQCNPVLILWTITSLLFYLPSCVNPIICFTFIQSYRNGLKEFCKQKIKTDNTVNAEARTRTLMQRLGNVTATETRTAFCEE